MKDALIVERPGLQSLVVDAGRFGYRHQGVAWCGPADALAHDVANALVCNDARSAAVEVLFGNISVRFETTRAFALAGADCEARLDGARCVAWAKHIAREGQLLTLHSPKRGVFTYLSVSGGIDVPEVLGSRTTDRTARFGGWQGRALQAGDRLSFGAATIEGAPFAIAPPSRRETVRVIPCGEIERFEARSRDALWAQPWRAGHDSNRMGYRLHGASLEYRGDELSSHAVFPGVIQVPPSGEPIVLLADAHTTGGYPKAGIVVDADLRHVAQTRPGETLRFVPVDTAEAAITVQARIAYVQTLRALARERSDL